MASTKDFSTTINILVAAKVLSRLHRDLDHKTVENNISTLVEGATANLKELFSDKQIDDITTGIREHFFYELVTEAMEALFIEDDTTKPIAAQILIDAAFKKTKIFFEPISYVELPLIGTRLSFRKVALYKNFKVILTIISIIHAIAYLAISAVLAEKSHIMVKQNGSEYIGDIAFYLSGPASLLLALFLLLSIYFFKSQRKLKSFFKEYLLNLKGLLEDWLIISAITCPFTLYIINMFIYDKPIQVTLIGKILLCIPGLGAIMLTWMGLLFTALYLPILVYQNVRNYIGKTFIGHIE